MENYLVKTLKFVNFLLKFLNMCVKYGDYFASSFWVEWAVNKFNKSNLPTKKFDRASKMSNVLNCEIRLDYFFILVFQRCIRMSKLEFTVEYASSESPSSPAAHLTSWNNAAGWKSAVS